MIICNIVVIVRKNQKSHAILTNLQIVIHVLINAEHIGQQTMQILNIITSNIHESNKEQRIEQAKTQQTTKQCDQVWQNSKCLAIFEGLFNTWNKMFNLLQQFFLAIGQIFIHVNGFKLNNIWSRCNQADTFFSISNTPEMLFFALSCLCTLSTT